MATFSTWTAFRTAIKDAMADAVAGRPFTESYRLGSFSRTAKSFKELQDLMEWSYRMESVESSATSTRVSYGRYRRFP